MNINWGKADLSNFAEMEEVESRLLAAVYKLADEQNRSDIIKKLKTLPRIKRAALVVLIGMFLSVASSDSKGSERMNVTNTESNNVYSTSTKEGKKTPILGQIRSIRSTVFSPHLNMKNFKMDDAWKVIPEPLALALSIERGEKQDFTIIIPYEFSRLFDTGNPINPEDYEKLNEYVAKQIEKEIAERIIGFSWDREALKEKKSLLEMGSDFFKQTPPNLICFRIERARAKGAGEVNLSSNSELWELLKVPIGGLDEN